MNCLDSLPSAESNIPISQHFPFSPIEQTLGAAEALAKPFPSLQLCWEYLEATDQGKANPWRCQPPTSTPERAAPPQWKAQSWSPAGLLSFSGHRKRRTFKFDKSESRFWVLLLDWQKLVQLVQSAKPNLNLLLHFGAASCTLHWSTWPWLLCSLPRKSWNNLHHAPALTILDPYQLCNPNRSGTQIVLFLQAHQNPFWSSGTDLSDLSQTGVKDKGSLSFLSLFIMDYRDNWLLGLDLSEVLGKHCKERFSYPFHWEA